MNTFWAITAILVVSAFSFWLFYMARCRGTDRTPPDIDQMLTYETGAVPLAKAYIHMGRLFEATIVTKKAVKAAPKNKEMRIFLARIYEMRGKKAKAVEQVLTALQLAPDHNKAQEMLGRLEKK